MVNGHKIEELVNPKAFLEEVKDLGKADIECSEHAFFRLSEAQREVFNCDTLRGFLIGNEPLLVGRQYNGSYSAFYDFAAGLVIRIVFDYRRSPKGIYIVTFYTTSRNALISLQKNKSIGLRH